MTTIDNTFRSKVFKAAWTSLRNGRSENLSDALKSAWAWAKKTLVDTGVDFYQTVKETAKAICIKGYLVCVNTDQAISKNLWIPKSLIKNGVIPTWFFNKKVSEAMADHAHYSNNLEFELA